MVRVASHCLVLVLACLPACLADAPETNAWKYQPAGPEEHWDKDCSGEHYFNGCDDCNPCTFDNWCDPTEWDAFIPEWCAGVAATGEAACVHAERSTPIGQINDCFPIAPVTDVRAGKCCVGTCVDNGAACDPNDHTF